MNVEFEVSFKIRSKGDVPSEKASPEPLKKAASVAKVLSKVAAHPLIAMFLREVERTS